MDDGRKREIRKEREQSEGGYDSSSSYASSDEGGEIAVVNEPKKHEALDLAATRVVDGAVRLQKERRRMQRDLAGMVQERSSLNRQIATMLSTIEAARKGLSSSRQKRTLDEMTSGSEKEVDDSVSPDLDEFGRPTAKKRLLQDISKEREVDRSDSKDGKTSARAAIKSPLMQRLLVGTLQRSQKEVERDKTDKAFLLKADKERQTEEKLEAESLAQKQSHLAHLESKLQDLKQKLQLLSISLAQKQEELDTTLREEHEGYLRGNWLFTQTEPRLYFRFAKYDEKVEEELNLQAPLRASASPALLYKRGSK